MRINLCNTTPKGFAAHIKQLKERHKKARQLNPDQQAKRETQREAALAKQERIAAYGSGTYLHKLLKHITGEEITASCKCGPHIVEMNMRGPAWCRENVETIVGWLEEEIDRRLQAAEEMGHSPGWRLKLAGYRLPGQRLAMRKVILLACTLAEKAEKSNDKAAKCNNDGEHDPDQKLSPNVT